MPRRSSLITACVVAGVVGTLAGCGGGGAKSTTATTASTAAPNTTATTSPPTSTLPGGGGSTTTVSPAPTTTQPTTTQPSGPGLCGAAHLKADFNIQPPGANQPDDQTRMIVALTNTSASNCTVYGFAGIGIASAGGVQSVNVNRINQPGPPVSITLKPQTSAFAGGAWTSGPACASVATFVLTPPEETVTIPVTLVQPDGTAQPTSVCQSSGIALGPFQPSSQGVVAFAGNGAGT